MPPADPVPGERSTSVLDLRLVPFAAAAWIGTGVALVAGATAAAVLAGLASVGAAVVVGVSCARSGHRMSAEVPVTAFVLVAAAVFASCFAGTAAVRVHVAETGLVAHLARAGATATVTVVLVDDPKLPASSSPGRPVRVLARAISVSTAEGSHPAGGAVTVFAPAAGWDELVPGQVVTVRARLNTSARAGMTVAILRVSGPPADVAPPPPHQRWAAEVRTRLAAAAADALPTDAAGLLPGLVVGDTSAQLPQTRTDFTASGLAHLTAVSGANVSILLGAVLLVVRAVGVGPRAGALLAGVALVAFVVVARPSPSVLRAAAMGTVALLALVVGRRKQALPALAASVIVLLAVWPSLAVDYGFALSVSATAALVVIAPVWVQWLRVRGWPRAPAEILAVSTAACVVTAPLVAAMSGTVSLVSVAANVAVAPVVAMVTVVGAVGALVALLHAGAAAMVLTTAGPPLWWILEVASRTAGLPSATVAVPDGLAGAAVTLAVLVLLVVGWWRRGSPSAVCLTCLALLTLVRALPPG